MKNVDDLQSAVSRMRAHYRSGVMDRDVLRKWVTGLGSYPAPHGPPVAAAKIWFATAQGEVTDEIRLNDLRHLSAMLLMPT